MPAGAKILPYRSNVPKLSEFCFTVCDKDFPERAKAKGGGIILGGQNYGQGSSREHAALVPLYLGVKAVIAKSFARIHMANLINFGVLPLTLKNETDYDKISEGDSLYIEGYKAAVEGLDELILKNKTTGEDIPLSMSLSARQREILLHGGTLNYTKAKA
jgi:aconitate hydratase